MSTRCHSNNGTTLYKTMTTVTDDKGLHIFLFFFLQHSSFTTHPNIATSRGGIYKEKTEANCLCFAPRMGWGDF